MQDVLRAGQPRLQVILHPQTRLRRFPQHAQSENLNRAGPRSGGLRRIGARLRQPSALLGWLSLPQRGGCGRRVVQDQNYLVHPFQESVHFPHSRGPLRQRNNQGQEAPVPGKHRIVWKFVPEPVSDKEGVAGVGARALPRRLKAGDVRREPGDEPRGAEER